MPTTKPELPQFLQAGARVRVQVVLVEVLGEVRLLAAKLLGCEVEAGPKVLEGLPVVLATGDDRAKHGGEGMAGDPEPVRPGAVLGGLVDQCLADVEHDGAHVRCFLRRFRVERRAAGSGSSVMASRSAGCRERQ
jgi:hypothetical protein